MTTEVDDVLAHFGILGMKWGVRNEPGKGGRQASNKTTTSQKVSNVDKSLVGKKYASKIASGELSRAEAYGRYYATQALLSVGSIAIGKAVGSELQKRFDWASKFSENQMSGALGLTDLSSVWEVAFKEIT